MKFRSPSNAGYLQTTATMPKSFNIIAHVNTIFTDSKKRKHEKAKSRLDESIYLSTTLTQANSAAQAAPPQQPLKPKFLFNEEESLAQLNTGHINAGMMSPKILKSPLQ